MRFFILIIFFAACATNCKAQTDSIKFNSQVEATLISTTIDYSDKNFLVLKIYKDKYFVSFLQDSIVTNKISTIDKFISKRVDKIQKDKVLVVGHPDASYTRFKPLKEVLKKYEFYKFRIETDKSLL